LRAYPFLTSTTSPGAPSPVTSCVRMTFDMMRFPYRPAPAYGSRAISRAFLTARAMRRCSCTETPVMRRARIFRAPR